MNDPRMTGGPVGLGNWSKPGATPAEEGLPPEEGKPTIKCPECGAEFELKEPEETEEAPEVPPEAA